MVSVFEWSFIVLYLPLAPQAQGISRTVLAHLIGLSPPPHCAGHALGLNLDCVEVSLLPVWVIADRKLPPFRGTLKGICDLTFGICRSRLRCYLFLWRFCHRRSWRICRTASHTGNVSGILYIQLWQGDNLSPHNKRTLRPLFVHLIAKVFF